MKKDIKDRVTELLATGAYDIVDSDLIPGPGDSRLTFGNTAVRFTGSALYIDMRGSTKVLNEHHGHTVAKIHKAYLYAATTIIVNRGGQIRSYNGDSILAFFPKNQKDTIGKAVQSAMEITYMLAQECSAEFSKYHPLDFGIGIAHGSILCVKAGKGRNDNHNDLLWLGNPVNRAVVLSDRAKASYHIWITQHCYNNLPDYAKLSKGEDMWNAMMVTYNDALEYAYKSSYHWKVS